MELKNQKENLMELLLESYNYHNDNLARIIIEDFVERIEDYGEDDRLENIVDDITGNYNGSYNCSTFESARIIAENIFEFIALVEDIQMFNGTRFDITEVERNLAVVLDYICQNTILAQDCETLGELINKLAE